MPNILVVCTANICRSPVVTALLHKRLLDKGYSDWQVESAGTWAVHARGAARNSIKLMAQQNIDIRQHRARMVDEAMLTWADLVLCMELGHVEALQVEFPAQRPKIYALSEMVGKKYSIPDPYGGPLTAYKEMVAEVANLIDNGFERIVGLAQKS